ncbi:hypothetical protein ACH419_30470 [Streptomyces bobili]|uniref:hypothetical protein n=1 Tax=Streptomyces bobili TaxID=67280 RepID=UPI00378CCD44
MSEPSSSLPDTLARLRALITEKGLDEKSVLDVARLSRQALLSEAEVGALLAGLQLADTGSPEEVVKGRVKQRLPRVYQAYLESQRVTFPDGIRTLEAKLHCSGAWARQLVGGSKVPSVGHLSVLAEFFKLDERLLTGAPTDNLNRVLQPYLQRLDTRDPIADLMTEYGLADISYRRRVAGLAPDRRELLANVIKSVLESER